jgi:hypothetical protein
MPWAVAWKRDVPRLALTSFLFTRDQEKAERCFVAGLEPYEGSGSTLFSTLSTLSTVPVLNDLKHSLIRRHLASFGSGMRFAFRDIEAVKQLGQPAHFSAKKELLKYKVQSRD